MEYILADGKALKPGVVPVSDKAVEEPETTPPLRFAESVSPVSIMSTFVVSDTAKLVLEEMSSVPVVDVISIISICINV